MVGSRECGNGHSAFHKTRDISRLSEDLLASTEGLCSMEQVRQEKLCVYPSNLLTVSDK